MRNASALSFSVALLATGFTAVSPANAQSGDGYLFRTPTVTLFVNGGISRPDASSALFTDAAERLSLRPEDFVGGTVNAGLSVNLGTRVSIGATIGHAARDVRSEYLHWDENGLPIEQNTLFSRTPVMANVKLYLIPRGREIGRFAWVPAKVAPYIGTAAGGIYYRFRQNGDFIDFNGGENPPIFTSSIEAEGWAPAAQLLGGLDFNLTPRLMLTGEANYTRASDELPSWFEDFDGIDLSGFAATLGLSLRI